mgnify:CR=1 FL=1
MTLQLTSGLQPELLSEEQKQWLANAICGAITADGSIAPEEVEYLERALSFLPTQMDVKNMMQAVKDQKLPQLGRLPSATRELEVKIFIDLATVISVDNILGANEIDFLFVDTPAGASDSSVEFAAACNKIIIVLVGEPTSFMDAYAFIKALNLEKKVERVSIVVNMAKDAKDANNSFKSFQKIVSQFLDVELINLGWLPNSKLVANSILTRKPFILNSKADAQLNARLSEIVTNIERVKSFQTNSVRFFDK